jgi:hypothetical protein
MRHLFQNGILFVFPTLELENFHHFELFFLYLAEVQLCGTLLVANFSFYDKLRLSTCPNQEIFCLFFL